MFPDIESPWLPNVSNCRLWIDDVVSMGDGRLLSESLVVNHSEQCIRRLSHSLHILGALQQLQNMLSLLSCPSLHHISLAVKRRNYSWPISYQLRYNLYIQCVVELVLVLNLLDRAQLLKQELLKQRYAAPKLKSSLQKCYGRHHDLVDRYEISISQCIFYFFLRFFLSLPPPQDFYRI